LDVEGPAEKGSYCIISADLTGTMSLGKFFELPPMHQNLVGATEQRRRGASAQM
jgi:hypothetical protein